MPVVDTDARPLPSYSFVSPGETQTRSSGRIVARNATASVVIAAKVSLIGPSAAANSSSASATRSNFVSIVDAVVERGAVAALEYGESFDGVRPAAVRVPKTELDAALTGLPLGTVKSRLRSALERMRGALHTGKGEDTP